MGAFRQAVEAFQQFVKRPGVNLTLADNINGNHLELLIAQERGVHRIGIVGHHVFIPVPQHLVEE